MTRNWRRRSTNQDFLFSSLKLLAHNSDWRVALSEHAWRDPNSEDPKFFDIVLRGRGDGPQRLVIECKRARGTEWIRGWPQWCRVLIQASMTGQTYRLSRDRPKRIFV
jgi:hypothetical protein